MKFNAKKSHSCRLAKGKQKEVRFTIMEKLINSNSERDNY